jgi:hypothetical protein
MEVLLLWAIWPALCLLIADRKARSKGLAIFWGIFLGPFAVLVYCCLASRRNPAPLLVTIAPPAPADDVVRIPARLVNGSGPRHVDL